MGSQNDENEESRLKRCKQLLVSYESIVYMHQNWFRVPKGTLVIIDKIEKFVDGDRSEKLVENLFGEKEKVAFLENQIKLFTDVINAYNRYDDVVDDIDKEKASEYIAAIDQFLNKMADGKVTMRNIRDLKAKCNSAVATLKEKKKVGKKRPREEKPVEEKSDDDVSEIGESSDEQANEDEEEVDSMDYDESEDFVGDEEEEESEEIRPHAKRIRVADDQDDNAAQFAAVHAKLDLLLELLSVSYTLKVITDKEHVICKPIFRTKEEALAYGHTEYPQAKDYIVILNK